MLMNREEAKNKYKCAFAYVYASSQVKLYNWMSG
jgi:hypothetical protein